jgi:hypothetical protein
MPANLQVRIGGSGADKEDGETPGGNVGKLHFFVTGFAAK